MTSKTNNNESKEFALGPCAIFAGRGTVSESELERECFSLGTTDGGVKFFYEAKLRELFDVEGNLAGTLRYGEKIRIKGRLCRVTSSALECFTRKGRVSVLAVCPLPDGEELRLYLRGGVPQNTIIDASFGGGATFDMVFGREIDGCFRITGDREADNDR